jgi:hypothetical protein
MIVSAAIRVRLHPGPKGPLGGGHAQDARCPKHPKGLNRMLGKEAARYRGTAPFAFSQTCANVQVSKEVAHAQE